MLDTVILRNLSDSWSASCSPPNNLRINTTSHPRLQTRQRHIAWLGFLSVNIFLKMINVLPIRGGSCQLCLRRGPLTGLWPWLACWCVSKDRSPGWKWGSGRELWGGSGPELSDYTDLPWVERASSPCSSPLIIPLWREVIKSKSL